MKTLLLVLVLVLALFPTASSFVVRSNSIRNGPAIGFSAKGLFGTMGASSAAVGLTQQYAPQAVVSRTVISVMHCRDLRLSRCRIRLNSHTCIKIGC
jgi:hypothetical protein